MSFRVIIFALALLAVYSWRGRPPDGNRSRAVPAVLGSALFLVLFFWVLNVARTWGGAWHTGILEELPLDACVVGAVIGFLVADQMRQLPAFPATDEKPTGQDGVSDRLIGFFRGVAPSIGIAMLVLAALVEPSVWTNVAGRLQGFKAGAVEFTLAAARAVDLSQDIRKAALPRSAESSSDNGIYERIGFIPVRLSIMQSYTLPPAIDPYKGESAAEISDELILSEAQQPIDHTYSPTVRQVRRDGAVISKLIALNASGAWLPSAVAATPQSATTRPGAAQEELLTGFAPHVRCLSAFVKLTQNRRLLEYQNFHIVQDIFLLAHLWTEAERAAAQGNFIAWPEPSRRFPDKPDGLNGDQLTKSSPDFVIATRLNHLAEQFDSFQDWASRFLTEWSRISAGTSGDRRSKELLDLCALPKPGANPDELNEPRHGDNLRAIAIRIRDEGLDPFITGRGFSPYLAILAAGGLSAIGDHASAVELLVQWLADLESIEAGKQAHAPVAGWYRLEVLDAILTLQRFSEGADISIPQSVDELRAMATRYFPDVLVAMGETRDVRDWRGDKTPACANPSNRWKQRIVLSYATWVKQYLDVSVERSETTSDSDAELADMLADMNLGCFPVSLGATPLKARFSQAEQSLQFAVTAAAIQLNALSRSHPGASEGEWKARRDRTAASLKAAILSLERAPRDTSGADALHILVYGQPGTDLLTNAKNLQDKLAHLPQPS